MNDQKNMKKIGQIRIDLNDCESIQCPICVEDATILDKAGNPISVPKGFDRFLMEIELKRIPAVMAGREMITPMAYLICRGCDERLVIDGQLVVINLGMPGE